MEEPNPNLDYNNVMKNKNHYFTLSQLQQILTHFYKKKQWPQYTLFWTLMRTGRRITELLGKPPYTPNKKQTLSNYKGLRPTDIKNDIQAIEVEILKKQPIRKKTRTGKKRDQQTITKMHLNKKPIRKIKPIDKQTLKILNWYIKSHHIQPEERLWPVSRFTANLWLKEAIKETQIKMNLGYKNLKIRNKQTIKIPVQPHLHMIRHSFSVIFLNKNKQDPRALPLLKDLLEHSNINMTLTYTELDTKDKAEYLDKTWT